MQPDSPLNTLSDIPSLESPTLPETNTPPDAHTRWRLRALIAGTVTIFISLAAIYLVTDRNLKKTNTPAVVAEESLSEDDESEYWLSPTPAPTPIPWAPYEAPAGWSVNGYAFSPDKQKIAVSISNTFPNPYSGYPDHTASSSARLLLHTFDSKQEQLLLERPPVFRSADDVMDGPIYFPDIMSLAWAEDRNSLFFTGHSTVEEISLENLKLKTHFVFPKNEDQFNNWRAFFGLYSPMYWPEQKILTFGHSIWEGHQTWAVKVDDPQRNGVVIARPPFDGPQFHTFWGNDLVIEELCGWPDTEARENWNCTSISVKSFPDLQEKRSLKLQNTDDVSIQVVKGNLIGSETAADGGVYGQWKVDHRGVETAFWSINAPDPEEPDENTNHVISIFIVDPSLKKYEVMSHRISHHNESLTWEVVDDSRIIVRTLEETEFEDLPKLLSEQTFSIKEVMGK